MGVISSGSNSCIRTDISIIVVLIVVFAPILPLVFASAVALILIGCLLVLQGVGVGSGVFGFSNVKISSKFGQKALICALH